LPEAVANLYRNLRDAKDREAELRGANGALELLLEEARELAAELRADLQASLTHAPEEVEP
jgi:F0F1-type ATP synthase membrane subunit b/b'